MKNQIYYFCAIIFILSLSVLANAQITSVIAVSSSEKVVKGTPYSAETVSENVRTLENGSKITTGFQTKVYRDSEGRTRTEQIPNSDKAAGNYTSSKKMTVIDFNGKDSHARLVQNSPGYYLSPETITIIDPVAGYSYYLNPVTKKARRVELKTKLAGPGPPSAPTRPVSPNQKIVEIAEANRLKGKDAVAAASPKPAAVAASPASAVQPGSKIESLAPRLFEGLECGGTRYTTTIKPGTIGNDLEIVITNESWYSKDLQLVVNNKRNDPLNGNYTYELKNIKREEPDKSLFVLPKEYTIVTPEAKTLRSKTP